MPSSEQAVDLVREPRDSLSTEIKTWFDPRTTEGEAKLAKWALAMRNNNGGLLAVGFSDETKEPTDDGRPVDLRAAFHEDLIQHIVSKYSSDPFEVDIAFVEQAGRLHPVLQVAAGVKTPVACKADLRPAEGRALLKERAVSVVLDIGSGFNTLGVVRWPMERAAQTIPTARFVRINLNEPGARSRVHPIGFVNRPAPILAASEPATGCR